MRRIGRGSIVAVVAGLLALAGCSSDGSDAAPGPPHWGYHGAEGPQHWGGLAKDYRTCETGRRQSPIDIVDPTPVATSPFEVRYRDGRAAVVDNGHTIQADASNGGTLTDAGASYELVQMHFHSPSETTIAGAHAPVEVHFVNADDDGNLAVVAAMVRPGAENAAWEPFLDAFETAEKDATGIDLAWSRLLPAAQHASRFDGSLTTPPCTEGVRWLVLDTPIAMSPAQIAAFEDAYSGNNRPTQPLDGRRVTEVAGSVGTP
jgi:carbonic anhydrase